MNNTVNHFYCDGDGLDDQRIALPSEVSTSTAATMNSGVARDDAMNAAPVNNNNNMTISNHHNDWNLPDATNPDVPHQNQCHHLHLQHNLNSANDTIDDWRSTLLSETVITATIPPNIVQSSAHHQQHQHPSTSSYTKPMILSNRSKTVPMMNTTHVQLQPQQLQQQQQQQNLHQHSTSKYIDHSSTSPQYHHHHHHHHHRLHSSNDIIDRGQYATSAIPITATTATTAATSTTMMISEAQTHSNGWNDNANNNREDVGMLLDNEETVIGNRSRQPRDCLIITNKQQHHDVVDNEMMTTTTMIPTTSPEVSKTQIPAIPKRENIAITTSTGIELNWDDIMNHPSPDIDPFLSTGTATNTTPIATSTATAIDQEQQPTMFHMMSLSPTALIASPSDVTTAITQMLPILPKYAIVFGTYDAYNPPGATNMYRKIRGRRRNIPVQQLYHEIYSKLLAEFQHHSNIYGSCSIDGLADSEHNNNTVTTIATTTTTTMVKIPTTPDELLFVRKYHTIPATTNTKKKGSNNMASSDRVLDEILSSLRTSSFSSTIDGEEDEVLYYISDDRETIYKKIRNTDRDEAVKKDINLKRARPKYELTLPATTTTTTTISRTNEPTLFITTSATSTALPRSYSTNNINDYSEFQQTDTSNKTGNDFYEHSSRILHSHDTDLNLFSLQLPSLQQPLQHSVQSLHLYSNDAPSRPIVEKNDQWDTIDLPHQQQQHCVPEVNVLNNHLTSNVTITASADTLHFESFVREKQNQLNEYNNIRSQQGHSNGQNIGTINNTANVAAHIRDYEFLLRVCDEAIQASITNPMIIHSLKSIVMVHSDQFFTLEKVDHPDRQSDDNHNNSTDDAMKRQKYHVDTGHDGEGIKNANGQHHSVASLSPSSTTIFDTPTTNATTINYIEQNGTDDHNDNLWVLRDSDCPWNERTCANAAANGELSILEYAYKNNCPWDETTCIKAVEFGHLHILEWAHRNGCPWDERICTVAAEKGYLHILQWARQHHCPWDADTCEKAAQHGHLHILRWAKDNGCEWDIRTCNEAAKNGHLSILQWARSCGCEWNATTCAGAAMNGQLHVLQWARLNGCDWDVWTCTRAAEYGHLNILQWARENGCPWDEWTCVYAAENGHLHVLQWARTNGCLWYSETCTRAAKRGHLNVLQWARANGCEWDVWTCTFAAENGHFDVLQWARTNGCPWDEWTCTRAAENGHLDILQWCRANGCPWNEWTCTRAAENGQLHVLQWARLNGCPWDRMTCAFAAENGHLDILQWLRANGCPWDELTCVYAAENGHLDVLQWARTNGCKWDYRTCSRAAKYGHLNLLAWARENGCPENHYDKRGLLDWSDDDDDADIQ